MLTHLKETKLSAKAWVTPFIILLGVIGGTTKGLLPFPLQASSLLIAGALAIAIQFGPVTLKRVLGPMKKGMWGWIILVILLSFALAFLTTFIGDTVLGIKPIANSALGDSTPWSKVYRFILVSFSLIGEEVITAAIAFPLFNLFAQKEETKKAWLKASIISALLFGLMHVNAYHWNLYQCLVAIGLTRLPFNWLWVKSDSLRGGIIAHVIYDAVIFIPMIIAAFLNQ